MADSDFSVPNVITVKPERTFWDKIIILHGLRQWHDRRGELRHGGQRISRHYYDVHQLMKSTDAENWLADQALARIAPGMPGCSSRVLIWALTRHGAEHSPWPLHRPCRKPCCVTMKPCRVWSSVAFRPWGRYLPPSMPLNQHRQWLMSSHGDQSIEPCHPRRKRLGLLRQVVIVVVDLPRSRQPVPEHDFGDMRLGER